MTGSTAAGLTGIPGGAPGPLPCPLASTSPGLWTDAFSAHNGHPDDAGLNPLPNDLEKGISLDWPSPGHSHWLPGLWHSNSPTAAFSCSHWHFDKLTGGPAWLLPRPYHGPAGSWTSGLKRGPWLDPPRASPLPISCPKTVCHQQRAYPRALAHICVRHRVG